ncbi:selenocysteine-specific translation elongation factor [Crenalkalicoccus roseus]|uniref:selenocysteine-specific translation elongation factor n=1 Tax=Crenalkalicoccus roseus TaxID=1485588 RepID=UPI001081374C|nr:selenocysteine-specific translation elongation factor [Crenalkalicoccus roseus]
MIVGTAGHIDHGKTSLVRALTGVDTDRLPEEKARGITIDLGFAYVEAPGGGVLGFVDVPGHERLVHTMIAGAASIRYALLVVAADDGVMPQTREHLQILELLGLREGVVALTKVDLVDAARREAAAREVRRALQATPFAGARLYPVSCATGEGIAPLREHLFEAAARHVPAAAGGALRFAVDRCFSLPGAGTVVTGSVVAGRVAAGEEVLVLPAGLRARIRALHAANRPAAAAVSGERCALNLAGPGIAREAVGRGDWVVDPTQAGMTARLDVELRLLESERGPLRTWTPAHLHHGAGQVPARILLLAPETLRPGETGLAQLVLERPRPLRHGDRLVLRDASARRTIAGAVVRDPRAPERRRRSPARLALLRALGEAEPAAGLRRLLHLPPFVLDLAAFAADRGLTVAERDAAARAAGALRLGTEAAPHAVSPAGLARLREEVEATLGAFHRRQPEQPGMTPEALRLALPTRLPPAALDALLGALQREGAVLAEAPHLRLPSHRPELAAREAALWARIAPLLEAAPFRPPRLREIAATLGAPEAAVRRACKQAARMGRLAEPAPDHFYLRPALAAMAEAARRLSAESPDGFTAAQFRDRLGTGRAQAIEVLEYFDRRGLTLRRGELRRVVRDPAALFGPAGGA